MIIELIVNGTALLRMCQILSVGRVYFTAGAEFVLWVTASSVTGCHVTPETMTYDTRP